MIRCRSLARAVASRWPRRSAAPRCRAKRWATRCSLSVHGRLRPRIVSRHRSNDLRGLSRTSAPSLAASSALCGSPPQSTRRTSSGRNQMTYSLRSLASGNASTPLDTARSTCGTIVDRSSWTNTSRSTGHAATIADNASSAGYLADADVERTVRRDDQTRPPRSWPARRVRAGAGRPRRPTGCVAANDVGDAIGDQRQLDRLRAGCRPRASRRCAARSAGRGTRRRCARRRPAGAARSSGGRRSAPTARRRR